MRGKFNILIMAIFSVALLSLGVSNSVNAADLTDRMDNQETDNSYRILVEGNSFKIVSDKEYHIINKDEDTFENIFFGMPGIEHLDMEKVVTEIDEAENSIKFTIQEDAIKGDISMDSNNDGLFRFLIPSLNEKIRASIQFVRNEDGTWDYSKNTVTFLNEDGFRKEKETDKQRQVVDDLFEKAKESGKLEDLEVAKLEEEKLPASTSRDTLYWRAIESEIRAKNPEVKEILKTEEITEESESIQEKSKSEVQAPDTGFESSNGTLYAVVMSWFALIGSTYFIIKKF